MDTIGSSNLISDARTLTIAEALGETPAEVLADAELIAANYGRSVDSVLTEAADGAALVLGTGEGDEDTDDVSYGDATL